jgi:hypothetical protein
MVSCHNEQSQALGDFRVLTPDMFTATIVNMSHFVHQLSSSASNVQSDALQNVDIITCS